MKYSSTYRSKISPIADPDSRPVWSVMIPTYNCAKYLREALQSVLQQDQGPELMQIEVIDDHSTKDDPSKIVEELSKGRVIFFRQQSNQGSVANFNTCIKRSRGHLVHVLHGDDFVAPGFYDKMQHLFNENSNIGGAFCRYTYVDANSKPTAISELEETNSGILSDWLSRIAVAQKIQPPSVVVRREVYEVLGGFDQRICCCAEDWEMWVRIASKYSFGFEPEPLAFYRMQLNSLTGNCARSGQNIRDIVQALSIISDYLPRDQRKLLLSESRGYFANYYVSQLLPKLLQSRDTRAILNQLRAMPRLSCSYRTWKQIFKVLLGKKARLMLRKQA